MPNTTTPMRTIVSGATTEPLTKGPKTRPKVGSKVDFGSDMQMLFVLQYAMAIARATEKAIVALALDVSCSESLPRPPARRADDTPRRLKSPRPLRSSRTWSLNHRSAFDLRADAELRISRSLLSLRPSASGAKRYRVMMLSDACVPQVRENPAEEALPMGDDLAASNVNRSYSL